MRDMSNTITKEKEKWLLKKEIEFDSIWAKIKPNNDPTCPHTLVSNSTSRSKTLQPKHMHTSTTNNGSSVAWYENVHFLEPNNLTTTLI